MGHSCGNDHSHLGNRELPVFLTGTTLTFLKPRLKRLLFPMAALLARTGVTANQVTLASLAGSIAVGAILCAFPDRPVLFGILPAWVLVRTACASLDGTLAVEFGHKSRLGGVLNETGDILSEIALFLPLMLVSSCTVAEGSVVIALVLLSEFAGLAGLAFGGQRRVEGPLGKADRSIVLSMGGVAVFLGILPDPIWPASFALDIGAALTGWNRLCLAVYSAATSRFINARFRSMPQR
jgi:CDP-diacylglycerol---glycerol-3-phosphate 3-phosphatidyltransferase